jgi:exopolysaccharide production protein ExoQ
LEAFWFIQKTQKIGLSLLVFAIIVTRTKQIISLCRQYELFLLLIGLAFFSAFWSQAPLSSLVAAVSLTAETFFTFYLFKRFSAERLLKLFVLLGWICLLTSIVLAIFFPQYGIDATGFTNDGWRGIYKQKNLCAETTVFLLSTIFFIPAKSFYFKISRLLYVSLSILLIYMTQSMTSKILLVWLIIYVTAVKIIENFALKERVLVMLFMLLAALAFFAVLIFYLNDITYFLGKDSTFTGRTTIWAATITSALRQPLTGYGYRAFWKGLQGESANVSLANGWMVTAAHNGYIDMWINMGIGGVCLFVYSLVKAFKVSFSCLRNIRLDFFGWSVCIVFLIAILGIDESAGTAVPNSLLWVFYIAAYVGVHEKAKQFRNSRIL